MRGKKGVKHANPDDPPRRRALKIKGHGTYANDLVPVVATLGRQTKGLRFQVVARTDGATLEALVERWTRRHASVNTDEWLSYNHLPRPHPTVKHRLKEWARDDDGDGIREVHVNGLEGRWLSVRNFLRPFRGVHKAYLSHYLALCVWTMTHRILRPHQLAAFVKVHDSFT